MERKPYVISEDIHIFLKEWAAKSKFNLPSIRFFKKLRKEMRKYLSGIFYSDDVYMISVEELRDGIEKLIIGLRELPAVSMDKVYFRTKPEIQIARTVDKFLNDCGIGPRFGASSIRKQLLNIKKEYKKIILVDDVLFSGKMVVEIIESFKGMGVDVPAVVIGITIGEGVRQVKKMTSSRVFSVRYYRKVIDEICERDFYPGVPLSGRLVVGSRIETGAPYLLPFGKPYEWASIPKEKEKEFSVFCLNQTIKLWEVIEKASGKIVRCCDLERIPIGISCTNKRFVNELKKRRANLLFLFVLI